MWRYSTGRPRRLRTVFRRWPGDPGCQRPWRCRHRSRKGCTSGNERHSPCRQRQRWRHCASLTAVPSATEPSPRHAAWQCTVHDGAAPDSRLLRDADRAVKLAKRKASAALMQPVILEGEPLEMVYQFDYLGCRFSSDCDDTADMSHRMAIAGERSRTLSHIWSDNRLPCQLKLRLYAACVCSTLTHGSEAWTLTPCAMKALNGFNSRKLHRITGRPYRDEATHPSYDLLAAIRLRRHRWLGHILRMPPERLLHRAVRALGQRGGPPYQPGSLLMDATLPMDQLSLRATDRTLWARDGRSLPPLQESP